MKNKTYLLNVLLAVLVTAGLAAALLVRAFQGAAVMPALSIPNLTLISLAALVGDYFLAPGEKRSWLVTGLLSLLTVLLLPWASGLVAGWALVKLAIGGCAVFLVCGWIFSSMVDRMSSGHHSVPAVLVSALGILLASQAFSGIFL